MSTELHPAQLVLPGRILKQELEARGWAQRDLAAILGRPEQVISEIITGSKQITPETSVELSQAFGTSPEFWHNLEANYRLELARTQAQGDVIARRSRLYAELPLREMASRGWLTLRESVDELEAEVAGCLGVPLLLEPPHLAVRWRGSAARTPLTYVQLAWLRRAETLARGQTGVGPWRADYTEPLVRELADHMRQAEDVAHVPATLARWGVRLVFLRHLAKTYLDGAAFWLEEGPVVALTLRYDRIDSFWFTLMHELAHLAEGARETYLDQLENGGAEDDAGDLPSPDAHEEAANRLASGWLLAPDAFTDFVTRTSPRFSRASIEAFATGQGRHPGIVLGRLQRAGFVSYRNLRGLLVKVSPVLLGQINE
ncbi:MAG: HigA family addiction module antitoxin [Chloroflexi bacterium]|nr:HigA family addiction module antitoxin [Chloroflexota bacterium]